MGFSFFLCDFLGLLGCVVGSKVLVCDSLVSLCGQIGV